MNTSLHKDRKIAFACGAARGAQHPRVGVFAQNLASSERGVSPWCSNTSLTNARSQPLVVRESEKVCAPGGQLYETRPGC